MPSRRDCDVVDRLIDQVRRRPEAIAVDEGGVVTTYAAFLARAMAFAERFAAHGAPRVMIATEKGCDAYAAMFGTLLAGGTYAPVNVSSPVARLDQVVASFEPDVIVAGAMLAGALTGAADAEIVDPLQVPNDGHFEPRAAGGLAYVIFTSGSTGTPKGVAISRVALAHYVAWLGPAMGIGPSDRMSQHPNIGFDLSVLDIYGALCWGAALHPFVEASARLLPARKVREDRITVWNSVPSVVSLMRTAGELDAAHLASVRLFTFCGEVLRHDQVAKIFEARPDAVVLNTYGPTEATVAMTCRRLDADTHAFLCQPSAPLGEPVGEMRLDLDGGGAEGEIVISGPQLAAGYWGDEALTASKFRRFVRPDETDVRAFYTGDRAVRIGGELYFLGRDDDMVKVRGHRIHLGEIRGALARAGWPAAFVLAWDEAVYAVVEGGELSAFDEAALIDCLSRDLDSYFVPRTILRVDRFPRSANDKVDAAALRALFEGGARRPREG